MDAKRCNCGEWDDETSSPLAFSSFGGILPGAETEEEDSVGSTSTTITDSNPRPAEEEKEEEEDDEDDDGGNEEEGNDDEATVLIQVHWKEQRRGGLAKASAGRLGPPAGYVLLAES